MRLPWYDSPTAYPLQGCRIDSFHVVESHDLRQPHFVYVLLMGFAPTGLCSEFVFCLAGVPLHFTPAYYPSSLLDLGCGTKEPQRGDRLLGRRWSMAEPLPENGKNPATKYVAVSVILFIFATEFQTLQLCRKSTSILESSFSFIQMIMSLFTPMPSVENMRPFLNFILRMAN